jgi:hypothetical protein
MLLFLPTTVASSSRQIPPPRSHACLPHRLDPVSWRSVWEAHARPLVSQRQAQGAGKLVVSSRETHLLSNDKTRPYQDKCQSSLMLMCLRRSSPIASVETMANARPMYLVLTSVTCPMMTIGYLDILVFYHLSVGPNLAGLLEVVTNVRLFLLPLHSFGAQW